MDPLLAARFPGVRSRNSPAQRKGTALHPVALNTCSPDETRRLGEALARCARPGGVLALYGELGAGKTVLAKGVAAGLDIDPRNVTSPTFVLMVRHAGRLTLFHFDAYRLADGNGLLDIGAEEMFFGKGLCVIEWADRVADVLPDDRIDVRMSVSGAKERALALTPTGPQSATWLRGAMDGLKNT